MKYSLLITLIVLTTGCASKRPPIPMVVSDHRYKINSENESEEIWRLAGYGEHEILVASEVETKEAELKPTEAELAALQYQRDVEKYIEIEQWRRASLPRQITAYFKPGKANIAFNAIQKRDLNALILRAARIDIRGRTDGTGADSMNDELALRRAVAAKRYLVDLGVDEYKISLNYSAENNYIRDDVNSKGRQDNRRVEIEFVLGAIPHTQ